MNIPRHCRKAKHSFEKLSRKQEHRTKPNTTPCRMARTITEHKSGGENMPLRSAHVPWLLRKEPCPRHAFDPTRLKPRRARCSHPSSPARFPLPTVAAGRPAPNTGRHGSGPIDGARADDDDAARAPGVPGGGVGVVHRVRVRVQGGRHGRVARARRRRQRHQRVQRLGAAQPLPRR